MQTRFIRYQIIHVCKEGGGEREIETPNLGIFEVEHL